MRKFLIALLFAGAAATPALAQDQNDNGHHHGQKNEGQAQQPQPQRPAQQQQRGNGGAYVREQAPQYVRQQPVAGEQGQRGFNQQRIEGRGYVAPRGEAPQQAYRGGYNGQAEPQQAYRGYRGGYNGQVEPQQAYRSYRGGYNGQAQEQVQNWNGQRGGWNQRGVGEQQVRQGNRFAGSNWNRDWRNDRRYDWRRYRDEHRSIFQIGIYDDPFGYGYQSFNVGFRLMPAYYGQQYWIDPAMYELPYPPPGTEWVRYWNDAILVDLYSGQVVDVIHNFFW